MEYWVSQGLFVIGYVILLLSFLFKKKQTLMAINVVGDCVILIGYVILRAYGGFVTSFLAMFRSLAFSVLAKKNIRQNYLFLALMQLIAIFGFIYTWEGMLSIILLVANLVFIVGCWQDKRVVLIATNIYLSISIITYNVLIHNYAPILMEAVYAFFMLLFFIKECKRKNMTH
jgi:hypothetical protein